MRDAARRVGLWGVRLGERERAQAQHLESLMSGRQFGFAGSCSACSPTTRCKIMRAQGSFGLGFRETGAKHREEEGRGVEGGSFFFLFWSRAGRGTAGHIYVHVYVCVYTYVDACVYVYEYVYVYEHVYYSLTHIIYTYM